MTAAFDKLVRLLKGVAMAGLVAMMAVTAVDVALRVALNELILGSVEIVQLTLVVVVFLALPDATSSSAHVTVDVVDKYVSQRSRGRITGVAAFLTALVLSVTAWRTVPPALDVVELGDMTTDLGVSFFWYWLPIIVGTVVAAAAAWIVLVRKRGRTPTGADPSSSSSSSMGPE